MIPCDSAAVVGYANFGVPGGAPAGCFGVVRRRSRGDFRELFFPIRPNELRSLHWRMQKKKKTAPGGRIAPSSPPPAGRRRAGSGRARLDIPPAAAGDPRTPPWSRSALGRGPLSASGAPPLFLLLRFCWFTFPQIRPRKRTFRR